MLYFAYMKTLNECIAEGFVPTRKYGWFEYKQDWVRHMRKLAGRMGFYEYTAYNVKFCISPKDSDGVYWYFGFYDMYGSMLPEMRLFVHRPGITHNLLATTCRRPGDPRYTGVPEEVMERMLTECDRPAGFELYLENWKNAEILEEL